MAAKTHCAVRRMIERRRVKSMLAVSVGIGSRCQDIKCEAGKKLVRSSTRNVTKLWMWNILTSSCQYIYTRHLRLCLAWSRDMTANVSHDHCVANLGIQEHPRSYSWGLVPLGLVSHACFLSPKTVWLVLCRPHSRADHWFLSAFAWV